MKYATLAEIFGKKGGALDIHLNRLKKPFLVRGSNGIYRLDSKWSICGRSSMTFSRA